MIGVLLARVTFCCNRGSCSGGGGKGGVLCIYFSTKMALLHCLVPARGVSSKEETPTLEETDGCFASKESHFIGGVPNSSSHGIMAL